MAAVLDPSKPFSAELRVIRRLNSSLGWTGGGDAREPAHADSPLSRFHPCAEHVALAPIRNDVPLLDPCCGQLSAGAEVNLGVKGRRNFIDFHHVASALWVPPGFRERPQTVAFCPSVDMREDKAWNSRRILRLNGKDRSLWTDNSAALQRLRYTSATQRSYEEVGWDRKLPRRLKAPETTLEKMADPVSEGPSSRRYNSRPQLWQSIGAEWNTQQLRRRNDPKKPISFCSGCPRSGQIPLYTGTIGSEDMDKLDNKDEEFRPLTLKRSIVPPYTPTARRSTIPGYTGRAAYADSGGADAAVCASTVSSPAHTSGATKESRSAVGHAAPLSGMVTTTAPCNPFLRPKLPVSHTNTRGDIRQSR
ncbi:hypothetical protein Q5P01_021172 [Channa striata]|uniref:Spermatogenesis-associated protein 48 n=1 Tax=Channa striata TaxID=64152 RepID=A0AA88LTR6_CHASR|nr:hypothetical protein Q5P01_021172 [Channa striata]